MTTPRKRLLDGVEVEAIDWAGRRRRYVCARCAAVRSLPPGVYRCRCGEPPARLRLGTMTEAARQSLERLSLILRERPSP